MSKKTATHTEALLSALSGLVTRLMQSSGMSAEEVGEVLLGFRATDAEAIDTTNTSNILTPASGRVAASKVLNDWIGEAPENLNTLEELANALNNNPDVINELIAGIATKESITAAQARVDALGDSLRPLISDSGDGVGTIRNFEHIDESKYISTNVNVLNTLASGKYFGYCKVNLLDIDRAGATWPAVKLTDETAVVEITVTPHHTDPQSRVVERLVRCGAITLLSRLDTTQAVLGTTELSPGWERLATELDAALLTITNHNLVHALTNSASIVSGATTSPIHNFQHGGVKVQQLYAGESALGGTLSLSVAPTGWSLTYTNGRASADVAVVSTILNSGGTLPAAASVSDYQARIFLMSGDATLVGSEAFSTFEELSAVVKLAEDVTLGHEVKTIEALVGVEIKHVPTNTVVKSVMPMALLIDARQSQM